MKGKGTPITVQGLQEAVGKESASVGQGRAFKAKWIGKEGSGFVKLARLNAIPMLRRFRNNSFLPGGSIGSFD